MNHMNGYTASLWLLLSFFLLSGASFFVGSAAEPDRFAEASKAAPSIQPLRCGSPHGGQVALTFDDGPASPYTRAILALLQQHKVRATFFVLGRQGKHNPRLLQAIAEQGHLLANHSWDHPRRASLAEWRSQIQRTEDVFRRSGVQPSHYFRPPHGIVSREVQEACAELGYTIVLYTVLSSDWQRPGAQALVEQVSTRLRPGGIVVLHDGGGNRSQTVAALPEIIRRLRQKGLEPVRLDQLLGPHPQAQPCAPAQR